LAAVRRLWIVSGGVTPEEWTARSARNVRDRAGASSLLRASPPRGARTGPGPRGARPKSSRRRFSRWARDEHAARPAHRNSDFRRPPQVAELRAARSFSDESGAKTTQSCRWDQRERVRSEAAAALRRSSAILCRGRLWASILERRRVDGRRVGSQARAPTGIAKPGRRCARRARRARRAQRHATRGGRDA